MNLICSLRLRKKSELVFRLIWSGQKSSCCSLHATQSNKPWRLKCGSSKCQMTKLPFLLCLDNSMTHGGSINASQYWLMRKGQNKILLKETTASLDFKWKDIALFCCACCSESTTSALRAACVEWMGPSLLPRELQWTYMNNLEELWAGLYPPAVPPALGRSGGEANTTERLPLPYLSHCSVTAMWWKSHKLCLNIYPRC